jgi:hypothetical protein
MAIDECEGQVIKALEKSGWIIVDKPFLIRTNTRRVLADFSITRQDETYLIVEVKCFREPDIDINNFYIAVGQYEYYRAAAKLKNMPYDLYLAMPFEVYQRLTQDAAMQFVIETAKIKILLVDLVIEEIVEWVH